MQWPFRFTRNGTREPQAPPVPATPPATRPATGLELISDLTNDFEKARVFVFLAGSLTVMAAIGFAVAFIVIIVAARELKGVPTSTTVSVGAGGASLISLVATIVTRWIKKLAKGARPTESTEPAGKTSP
jgi:hypothetical protein